MIEFVQVGLGNQRVGRLTRRAFNEVVETTHRSFGYEFPLRYVTASDDELDEAGDYSDDHITLMERAMLRARERHVAELLAAEYGPPQ